jgi:hypothetical protein
VGLLDDAYLHLHRDDQRDERRGADPGGHDQQHAELGEHHRGEDRVADGGERAGRDEVRPLGGVDADPPGRAHPRLPGQGGGEAGQRQGQTGHSDDGRRDGPHDTGHGQERSSQAEHDGGDEEHPAPPARLTRCAGDAAEAAAAGASAVHRCPDAEEHDQREDVQGQRDGGHRGTDSP